MELSRRLGLHMLWQVQRSLRLRNSLGQRKWVEQPHKQEWSLQLAQHRWEGPQSMLWEQHRWEGLQKPQMGQRRWQEQRRLAR